MLGETKAAVRWTAASRIPGAAVTAILFNILAAHADPAAPPGWREVWVGTDASRNVWLAYGGMTVAPTSDMFSDGVRFRVASGYGGYRYTGVRSGKTLSFKGNTTFAEALVGYLMRLGPLTAKGFVGGAAIDHDVRPVDPENPVQGMAYGPKAAIELWLNMGDSAWSSLDLAWTSAHQTYAGRLRSGYYVFDSVSIGLEARLDGNDLDKDARGGLFVRYAWDGGEVSLAGGVAGRFFEDAHDMTDPYATANWLVQY
jgi:Cellulose biosynthesis protein BcsS